MCVCGRVCVLGSSGWARKGLGLLAWDGKRVCVWGGMWVCMEWSKGMWDGMRVCVGWSVGDV